MCVIEQAAAFFLHIYYHWLLLAISHVLFSLLLRAACLRCMVKVYLLRREVHASTPAAEVRSRPTLALKRDAEANWAHVPEPRVGLYRLYYIP